MANFFLPFTPLFGSALMPWKTNSFFLAIFWKISKASGCIRVFTQRMVFNDIVPGFIKQFLILRLCCSRSCAGVLRFHIAGKELPLVSASSPFQWQQNHFLHWAVGKLFPHINLAVQLFASVSMPRSFSPPKAFIYSGSRYDIKLLLFLFS